MKRVLVFSGIHGDEPSGPRALVRLLRTKSFRSRCERYGIALTAIPFVNQTGSLLGARENVDGLDPNRWFFDSPRRGEPNECTMLRSYLAQTPAPFSFFISFHEDPDRRAFYLYDSGNGRHSPLIDRIFGVVRKHRVARFTGIDDPVLGTFIRDGYAGVASDNPAPTLEEYLIRNERARRGVTIEIPGKLPIEKKISLATDIAKAILFKTKNGRSGRGSVSKSRF